MVRSKEDIAKYKKEWAIKNKQRLKIYKHNWYVKNNPTKYKRTGKKFIPVKVWKKGNIPWNKGLPSYMQVRWKGGRPYYYRELARKIFEKSIGRKLLSSELIHHIDHNFKNNSLNNLEITNRSKHASYHMKIIHQARKNTREVNQNVSN